MHPLFVGETSVSSVRTVTDETLSFRARHARRFRQKLTTTLRLKSAESLAIRMCGKQHHSAFGSLHAER